MLKHILLICILLAILFPKELFSKKYSVVFYSNCCNVKYAYIFLKDLEGVDTSEYKLALIDRSLADTSNKSSKIRIVDSLIMDIDLTLILATIKESDIFGKSKYIIKSGLSTTVKVDDYNILESRGDTITSPIYEIREFNKYYYFYEPIED